MRRPLLSIANLEEQQDTCARMLQDTLLFQTLKLWIVTF